MLLTDNMSEIITNKSMLAEIFFSGCKTMQNIGVESEKLLVFTKNNRAIDYVTASKILDSFDNNIWQRVFENGNLMGLKSEIGTITLEPGSQIEISLKPFNSLSTITNHLTKFYDNLSLFAQKYEAKVLDIGIQPVSTYENIKIIPKKRYEYMTKYLPLRGLTPFIMMRETAGIQANFDYKSEEDAILKLSTAIKMSPIISAIYANSPIRNSKQTGYKSFRADSWLNVDENRCGYISNKLFEKNPNFSFSDYTDILLDVPMIFIQRGNTYFGTVQTFREFMSKGYMGMFPVMSDWENHISLYFPDVRLKSYVEIRNHDAQNSLMTFSVPAFWKGIMYNNDALEEVNKILSRFSYEDFIKLRKDSPIMAIKAKIANLPVSDLVKEFFDISYSSLKENKLQEEKYLDCVYEYISLKRVPADNINIESI